MLTKLRVINYLDSRYRKTHERLASSLLTIITERRSLASIRPVDVTRRAHIVRTTFYRHFSSITDAISCIESELEQDFDKHLQDNPHPTPDSELQFLAIFILRHRSFFKAAFAREDYCFLHQLLAKLKTCLSDSWRHLDPKANSRVFELFLSGLDLILLEWAKEGFSESQLVSVVNHLKHYYRSFSSHFGILAELARASLS